MKIGKTDKHGEWAVTTDDPTEGKKLFGRRLRLRADPGGFVSVLVADDQDLDLPEKIRSRAGNLASHYPAANGRRERWEVKFGAGSAHLLGSTFFYNHASFRLTPVKARWDASAEAYVLTAPRSFKKCVARGGSTEAPVAPKVDLADVIADNVPDAVEALVLAARDVYNMDGELMAWAITARREALRHALQPFIALGREV